MKGYQTFGKVCALPREEPEAELEQAQNLGQVLGTVGGRTGNENRGTERSREGRGREPGQRLCHEIWDKARTAAF